MMVLSCDDTSSVATTDFCFWIVRVMIESDDDSDIILFVMKKIKRIVGVVWAVTVMIVMMIFDDDGSSSSSSSSSTNNTTPITTTPSPFFCNPKSNLHSLSKLQATWRKPFKSSPNSSKLILDLSHWGNHPMMLPRIRELYAREGDKKCHFPIPEWSRVFCRLKKSASYCNSSTIPCSITREIYKYQPPSRTAGKCNITTDIRRISDAGIVVINAFMFNEIRDYPNIKSLLSQLLMPKVRRTTNQLWAVHAGGESAYYYPMAEDVEFLSYFDYSWGNDRRFYQLHVPSYLPSSINALLKNDVVEFKNKKVAVYIISHCGTYNHRDDIVRELARYIPIDSLGACVPMNQSSRSRSSRSDRNSATWREDKIKLLREYKFTLAFENSNCHDYVTEKYIDPLIAGSVPVYLGADNIDDYLPHPNAIIKVSEFGGSVRELAQYILRVASDEVLYESYLVWRSRRGREELSRSPLGREIQIQRSVDPFSSVCDRVK